MERRGQGCSQVSCLEVINTRIHVEEHGGGGQKIRILF